MINKRDKVKETFSHQIVSAAVAEFGEKGYSPAMLSSIAKRAGVSAGLINKYFESKEKLFIVLAEEALDLLLASACSETDAETMLLALADEFKLYALEDPDRFRFVLMLSQNTDLPAETYKAFRGVFDKSAFPAALSEAQAEGLFTGGTPYEIFSLFSRTVLVRLQFCLRAGLPFPDPAQYLLSVGFTPRTELNMRLAEQRRLEECEKVSAALSVDYDFVGYIRPGADVTGDETVFFHAGTAFESAVPGWRNFRTLADIQNALAEAAVSSEERERFLSEANRNSILARLAEDRCFCTEYSVHLNGEPWRVFVRYSADRNKEGALVGVILALTFGNSDQKIAFENREKLERLTRELEFVRRKANAADDIKTKFLFRVSHDFSEPVKAVLDYAAQVRRDLQDPVLAADSLKKLRSSAELVQYLLNEVITAADTEIGAIQLNPVPADLSSLTESVKSAFAPRFREAGISFSAQTHIRDSRVIMDGNRVALILSHILGNALNYTPAGGTVTCYCGQLDDLPDGQAQFQWTVRDTGIGIDEDFQKHMFDLFSRGQTSIESGIPGMGLGLYAVRFLLELMGGSILIESRKGMGTTVLLSVPFPKCG